VLGFINKKEMKMNVMNKQIALDEANEMTLVSLSTEASTLTNGNGGPFDEGYTRGWVHVHE
jgi:hypothetical protein